MIIQPKILSVTPDEPTVQFKQSKDQIDLDKELLRLVNNQGWGCGTYFHVQFTNHEYTELKSAAKYVVTQKIENVYTNEANPYQPVTRNISNYKIERVEKWRHFGEEVKTEGTEIKWNPGLKVHQLKLGDEVIYQNADKAKVIEVAEGKAA